MHTLRSKFFLGYAFAGLTFSLTAQSTPLPETFPFVLQNDVVCASGYAADDESTPTFEKQCVSFDLSGFEASAFQAGVAIGEVGDSGEIRPFWPLVDIVFNTDPRPLPNPAVSPLIIFRFVRDELCPSHYAGEILDRPEVERGCLMFDLDGFRGSAVRKNSYFQTADAVWDLGEINFLTPKSEAIQTAR